MAILVRVSNANPNDPFKAGDIFRVTATTHYHCTPDDVTVHQELAPATGDNPTIVPVDAPKMRSIMRRTDRKVA